MDVLRDELIGSGPKLHDVHLTEKQRYYVPEVRVVWHISSKMGRKGNPSSVIGLPAYRRLQNMTAEAPGARRRVRTRTGHNAEA